MKVIQLGAWLAALLRVAPMASCFSLCRVLGDDWGQLR